MVRSKLAAGLLLIILAAIFLAVFFWRNDSSKTAAPKHPPASKQNATVSPGIFSPATAHFAIKTADSIYQLPSYDKPFDEVFEQLEQASDNGEAKATCRLAIELLRCQAILAMDQKSLLKMFNEPAPRGMVEADNVSYEKAIYRDSQMFLSCKKMHDDKILRTQEILEKAAGQKQVDAMVLWASGEWIQTRYGRRSHAFLQDPAYDRWRTSAIPTMNEALHQGSYGAALEWFIAYGSDNGAPFHGLVKNDPKREYTFSVLIRLLENSGMPNRSRTGLSTSDSLAAEEAARQMFEKWFDSQPTKKGSSSSSYGLRSPETEDCVL